MASLMTMRAVILGIGNVLLSDEAVGVRAVEAMRNAYRLPEGTLAIDGGTSGMELLDEIAGADLLIVLDAICFGQAAGTIVRLAGEQVPVFFRSKLSQHQLGISEVLACLEFSGDSPAETVVIGVEPKSFALGLDMTPVVAARVPDLVELAAGELRSHGIAIEPAVMEA